MYYTLSFFFYTDTIFSDDFFTQEINEEYSS